MGLLRHLLPTAHVTVSPTGVRSTRAGLRSLTVLTAFASSVWLTGAAHASSGDLDTSFSGDGKAVVNFGGMDFVTAAAEQPDGKVVVAGGSQGDFALARFLENGSLDTSFGTNGITTTDLGGSGDAAHALAIAPDGRIFAAGISGSTLSHDFAVVRYSADGTLEATSEGTYGGADASANDIGLAPDGGIFIAGGNGAGDFGVAKLTSALAFDNDFSGDGKLTRNFGGNDVAAALAVHPDGSVTVAGSGGPVGSTGTDRQFAVARFDSFGFVFFSTLTGFTSRPTDIARDVVLQEDGKMVVAGESIIQTAGTPPSVIDRVMAVARYNPNGTLDTTFDSDGKRLVGFELFSDANAVAVQLDGKIVLGGHVTNSGTKEFALARLHPTGALDTGFSGDGLLRTAFTGVSASPGALILQRRHGRIVAAGTATTRNSSGTVTNTDAALARYHAISCGSRDVTIIGTNGPDTILGRIFRTGTFTFFPLPDVIHGFGGADAIDGGGNDDTICGGVGGDTLAGGVGNDTLFGEGGSDRLDGGDGTDVCSGGGFTFPADTFQNCETVSTGGFSGFSIAAFYLSFDDQLDEGDLFLTEIEIPVLEPGETTVLRLNVKVHDFEDLSGLNVIAVLDTGDVVPEANEENNVVVSEPLQ